MFLEFYKLQEQPFRETPDPRFVFLSATHREALASLFYGLETGRGFLALIAEPGMGKTTLLFHLLEQLRNSARTAFLFQTQCDSRELLRSLLSDLGIETGRKDLAWMHDQLRRVLINESSAGRRLIVFIDETQNLTESALETVRLLSDFETPTSKLMQIVLSGQPQLADKLASPTLAQLRQRVSILCRLNPFTPAETDAYINHRLRVAGYKGGPLFTPEARAMIGAHSKGIPRTINVLCFNALSLGYGLGRREIDSSLVREVAKDLEVSLLGSERHDRAFGAQFRRGKAAVSETGKQVSALPATLIPNSEKSSSITREQAQGSSPVEIVNGSSLDATGPTSDSLPTVPISQVHTDSSSSSRQKWTRVLSLTGQQVPTKPGTSEQTTQVEQGAPFNAVVVESAKSDSKAFQAELRSTSRVWPLPTPLNSTTAIPESVRLATLPRTEMQGSGDVAESETVVFDLEPPVAPPVPRTMAVPRSVARLEHIWRTALGSRNNKIRLSHWLAIAALISSIAVASLGLRESVAHQRVASVSPIAASAEEKPDPAPMVSASPAEPRKSKPKMLSSTLRARRNAGPAPSNESVSTEPLSALSSVPNDPNITSHSLVTIAPNSPISPSPAPKSQRPEPDRLLEPPYLLYRVEPAYPRDAQEQGVEGTVRMRALVGADGQVQKVDLLSGPPLLASAAMSAARRWRYIPAILNGQPVESEEEIRIDFRPAAGSPRRAP